MNTVTQARIKDLLVRSQIDVCTKFDKVTVVTVRLPNGFVLVESAGAVDPANYNEEIGRGICLQRIENKLWELEGYLLSSHLAANLPAMASDLVSQIERCGASTELTTAVVMADDLRNALIGH